MEESTALDSMDEDVAVTEEAMTDDKDGVDNVIIVLPVEDGYELSE